jgi:hypothetical protein
MAFRYSYVSDEELGIESSKILAEGEASFTVKSAQESISKSSGANQLKICLLVKDRLGDTTTVWEYLPGTRNMAWKIRQFLKSIGCGRFYNDKGMVEPIFLVNKTGNCIIKTRKSDNPEYKDKTIIDKYIEKEAFENESQAQSSNDEDDDLPF